MAAELRKLRDAPVAGVTVVPSESDVGTWTVFVEGPTESVYSGSLFELVVSKCGCGAGCAAAKVPQRSRNGHHSCVLRVCCVRQSFRTSTPLPPPP
jgi:hypothetical protein